MRFVTLFNESQSDFGMIQEKTVLLSSARTESSSYEQTRHYLCGR
jgi:hypothetical protein